MRQQNQKSRSRGRGRKPQNPMSRNYESNGPDVKIRGNAAHIAEKYSGLARDALSNGDRVIAENYLQHAEHYNRIVAAAQAQQAQQRSERQEQEADNEEDTNQTKARDEQPDDAGSEKRDSGKKPNGRANVRANGSRQRHSEAAADSQDDNGDQEASLDSADDATENEERKPSRGRRPRKVADAKNGKAVTPDDADAPEVSVEAISDDAAKLPDSITGGMVGEES